MRLWSACCGLVAGVVWLAGCRSTPVDTSDFARGPAPLRQPSPARSQATSYEDSLNGGQVFAMYCAACHNARSLAERPFSNYKNVATHMRVRANLTGKESAELIAWLRRWHDVPPPHPPVEPSPKRFFFSQSINELRQEQQVAPAGPRPQQPAETLPAPQP